MKPPDTSSSSETPGKPARTVKPRGNLLLGLDIGIFVLVCVLMCVGLTGLTLHEWLGFIFSAFILFHVLLQWRWFVTQFRRMLLPGSARARFNFLLNSLLLVTMAVLLVSGMFVSHQLAPLVAEHLGRQRVWHEIHDCSNVAVIFLVSLHLGLNLDWILATLRRRASDRPALAAVAKSLPSRHSRITNLLVGGLAIASVAALAVCATYFTTAALMQPEPKHASIQNQHIASAEPTINAGQQTAPRPRESPRTGRGLKLFETTLLSTLAMAIFVRYVCRIHL